jgi:hypothetical protein
LFCAHFNLYFQRAKVKRKIDIAKRYVDFSYFFDLLPDESQTFGLGFIPFLQAACNRQTSHYDADHRHQFDKDVQ